MPLLVGEDGDWPERTLYIQWQRGNKPQLYGNFAAISEPFKLVQSRTLGKQMGRKPRFELYDIKADPGEQAAIKGERQATLGGLKAGYERWFRDVSGTRGYDPPRIIVGSEHENPVILTRQDWRALGADGWSDRHLGYWQVEVAAAGSYDIRFRFFDTNEGRTCRVQIRQGQAAEAVHPISRIRHVSRSRARCRLSTARRLPRPRRQDSGRKVRGCDEVGVGFLVVHLISSVTYI